MAIIITPSGARIDTGFITAPTTADGVTVTPVPTGDTVQHTITRTGGGARGSKRTIKTRPGQIVVVEDTGKTIKTRAPTRQEMQLERLAQISPKTFLKTKRQLLIQKKLSSSQKLAQTFFNKMGKKTQVDKKGNLVIDEGKGRKTVLNKKGTYVTVPKTADVGFKSVVELLDSKAKKEKKEQEKLSSSQKLAQTFFNKMGKKTQVDKKGNLVIDEGKGRKIVLNTKGTYVTVPKTADVGFKFVVELLDSKAKKEKNLSPAQRTIRNLFNKQGKVTFIDSKGNLIAIDKGKRIVVSKDGNFVEVPKGAKVNITLLGSALKDPKERKTAFKKFKAFLDKKGLELSEQKEKILNKKVKEKLPTELSDLDQRLITQWKRTFTEEKKRKAFVKKQIQLFSIGLVRGVLGSVKFISSPIKSTRESVTALRPKNIKRTSGGVVREFTIDPVGTITEFITFGKTLNLLSSTAKLSPVGRFVREELFIRRLPKNLQKPVRAIIKSSKAQEKINPNKIKSIKKVDFVDVKELNKIEAEALKKTLQETDSVVFGSVSGRVISKGKAPKPKDVDLATKDINVFYEKFRKNLPANQRKNYIFKKEKIISRTTRRPILDVKPLKRLIPARSILTGRGLLPVSGIVKVSKIIESVRKFRKKLKEVLKLQEEIKSLKTGTRKYLSKFKKIIKEQKKLKKLKQKISISDLPKREFKLLENALQIKTQKLVKIEGIKLVGFGEQTTRKGLGTLQVLIEKNIKRAKDPQAFVLSLLIQIEGLKKLKFKTRIGGIRTRARIKTLENAVKILTSKKFKKLLEEKAPGITKDYPILNKINNNKLNDFGKVKAKARKVNKEFNNIKKKINSIKTKKKLTTKDLKDLKALEVKFNKLAKQFKVTKSELSRLKKAYEISKIPIIIKSKLKPSKLKKVRPSKLKPSVLKRAKPSKLKPALTKRQRASILPSRLKTTKPSILRSVLKKPLISRIPSNLKKAKLPPSILKDIRDRVIKPGITRKIKREDVKKKVKKILKNKKLEAKFKFIPDLVSLIFDIRATAKQRARFLKKGRIFTGLEERLIVISNKKRR